LLKRSIEPEGPTFGEKVSSGGKRLCVVSAIAALILGALDLANVRSVEAAVDFFHNNRQLIAELPDRIRSEIGRISIVPESPSVTVAIPRDIEIPRNDVAAIVPEFRFELAAIPARPAASALAELAAARHLDALDIAMTSPPFTKTESSVAASQPTGMILASADEGAVLETMPSTPVSLPMSAAIPLDMVPLPRPAPGVPPPSPAERLHLDGNDRVKAERCLANAIYFEARSEPLRGQMAVAQVVVNRAFSGFYPNERPSPSRLPVHLRLRRQEQSHSRARRMGARQPHRQADPRWPDLRAGSGEVDALSRRLRASELGG
jgi:hypothetical protein